MQYREKISKANCTQISPWPNLYLTFSTYHQTDWDITGSPVKYIVKLLKMFKISMSQTTLHLLADRANSHEAEMASRLAACLSSS